MPKADCELTDVETEKPIERINELENEKAQPTEFDSDLHFKQSNELTDQEIEFIIAVLIEEEKNVQFNKARRSYKKRRLELEAELERRRIKKVG